MPGPPPVRRRRLIAAIVACCLVCAGALAAGAKYVLRDKGAKSCVGPKTRLNVLSSPEKGALMLRFAHDFGGRRVAGRCASVRVQTMESGQAAAALARGWRSKADGGPRPDVWSPAGTAWVTLLRQRLADSGQQGDAASYLAGAIPAVTPSIASSPLVIAMPRPMAQALGWPDRKLGWSDLLALARDPKGWKRYGHPEWGAFRLGKTNPNFSTSGLNATIAAFLAVRPKDQRAAIRDVEGSVVHYGDSTLAFLAGLRRADDAGRGLSYVSAVAMEEMSVWDYNHAKPKTPLVAIYPKEGTLVSDHPYVAMRWADSAHQKVASAFLTYLRSPAAQNTFSRNAYRSYRNTAGPLITEANGLLPKEPVRLLRPPQPAVLDRMLRGWTRLRKRAHVLFVMDVSGSMAEPGAGNKSKMRLAKSALTGVLPRFRDTDEVGLWAFSTHLHGAADYRRITPVGKMSAGRRGKLRKGIARLKTSGDTGLYDTTLAASRSIGGHPERDAINAVVVLTDGKNDDDHGISLTALLAGLRTGPPVFTVAYGKDADQGVLKQISDATGGVEYASPNPGDIDHVLASVTSNF